MAYTASNAITTFFNYTNIDKDCVEFIEGTKKRGMVITFDTGEKIVVFIYPLVHKQDNTKNYFDTRDSGAKERGIAWNYALNLGLKYFCLGVNEQVDKYRDYIFSLECSEEEIRYQSGTDSNGSRSQNGSGNQIIIPNDYVPRKDFERIRNNLGVYIACIKNSFLWNYTEMFDNRPYLDMNKQNEAIIPIPITINELDIDLPRNKIFFGAPGTGKSYTLNIQKNQLLDLPDDYEGQFEQYERVTFHPDYTYANFVGTYKPIPEIENGVKKITYEFVPGPFIRTYIKAIRSAMSEDVKPYVLIIEEINRANVAGVFGDVFQLLDRKNNGESEYAINASEDLKKYLAKEDVLGDILGEDLDNYSELKIPGNMFIWATMNSADQGVYPMDTAFKRRWNFKYLGIDEREADIKKYDFNLVKNDPINWNCLRKAINARLSSLKINEDKQLGPFFISKNILDKDTRAFKDAFINKVIMYLFEDAAKSKRNDLFNADYKSLGDVFLYSELCKKFNEVGIKIFNDEIVKIHNELYKIEIANRNTDHIDVSEVVEQEVAIATEEQE